MASSSSLCNFLSFISSPTKSLSLKSPPQPRLLPQIRRRSDKWVPLVANAVGPSSSSSSSDDTLSAMAIACPSLAYANTLFFKSAYNVQVIVDDNEPEEKLLGRFRREVMRAGVIQECKRRRFFENKQDEKKRKTREAAKRNKRRRPQWRSAMQNKEEASAAAVAAAKRKADEEEDNWELPEGDLPN